MEQKYLNIFNNAVEGIFLTTPAGEYLEVNPALASLYGFSSPEELKTHFKDISSQLYVDPRRRREFAAVLERDKKITGFESQVRKKNGDVIWITENARAVFDDRGNISYYEGTVMDITDRKEAEQALELQRAYFSQLFENSPQGIVIIDNKRNIVNCNRGFEELFGFSGRDIIGFGVRALIVPDDLLVECETLREKILDGRTVQSETYRCNRKGERIPVSMIGFPVTIENQINGIIYIYQDISERKTFEQQITHQAFHDALTGLPNRTLFNERLDRALERSHRKSACHYALLVLDLNKFKSINDSLGHPAGDELLVQVSRRITGSIRAVDTAARLGGDEFAIILEEFPSKEKLLKVAKRIHTTLCAPYTLFDSPAAAGASIGIVASIAGYSSADNILKDADLAMYRAKQLGRGIMLFNERMRLEFLDTITLENDLRSSMERNELLLHYQPIVSVNQENLEGFEALVRWEHPLRGLIPPDRFIPMAEETGLIDDLGKWVIGEACRKLAQWQKTDLPGGSLTMSINVSVKQFDKPGLVDHIRKTLAYHQLEPSSLKLELTESIMMQDSGKIVDDLNQLRSLGIKIAIDDFGTGYSSLSYLRSLPIDHLKIDRSFISGGDDKGENDQIVQSIIKLAKSLGLTVIAEGVETRDQLEKLRNLDCDKAQGYMFSKPVDHETALNLIIQFAEKQNQVNQASGALYTEKPIPASPGQSTIKEGGT